YLGHVKMMAAVQPFISGAISKTVNMPEAATVEEVEQLHIDAWKMGLKAIAIYRDNCKVAQPLSGKKKEKKEEGASDVAASLSSAAPPIIAAEAVTDKIVVKGAVRRQLPRRRTSHTYKFSIADLKGFFTVGEFEDGTPGELFIDVSKQGSTLSGLMDSFAISVSHGLQYGVPLKSYVKTLMSSSFAPAGITDDPDIRTASSITDYIMRRLAIDYLSFDDRLELGLASFEDMPKAQQSLLTDDQSTAGQLVDASEKAETIKNAGQKVDAVAAAVQPLKEPGINTPDTDAPLCYNCGNQTQRAGSCYVCTSCGSTTGCS
ncbi:MAG TPA: hypothetical protein VFM05_10470, partial [Candidatus Saccharimonadales bacterium]|nr:hypothetical protein [Candidatus Saccharimonadales bacterium]